MSAAQPHWAGRAVAVLGGAGFIGSAVTRMLVEAGASVTVVDGLVPGCGGHRANLADVAGRIDFVEADLATAPVPEALRTAFAVFNLMGDPAHRRSVDHPLDDLRNNLTAHVALYHALAGWGAQPVVVLAGTRQVYGTCRDLPVDERQPLAPPDPNAIHKLAAEGYAELYQRLFGIPSVRLRLTNVYGPRQANGTSAHGVAGFLIGRLLRREPVVLYGGGTQRRDWTYVDDAAEALLAAAASPAARGGLYNIGHDRPVSLGDFVRAAQAAVGHGEVLEQPFPPEQAAIDIGDYATDARRAEADLGWRARTTLADGIRSTVDFYRDQGGSQWPA